MKTAVRCLFYILYRRIASSATYLKLNTTSAIFYLNLRMRSRGFALLGKGHVKFPIQTKPCYVGQLKHF